MFVAFGGPHCRSVLKGRNGLCVSFGPTKLLNGLRTASAISPVDGPTNLFLLSFSPLLKLKESLSTELRALYFSIEALSELPETE
ncbi:hypothetical protein PanWU01x14_170530 [Parasponia andersonii]|uniref:Uncharacterized protein n=1 Tax=Parasponia andersonii TaxID=3476 RepID=A0A2P5CA90_PARAD|nr:hypothetical protein PanWU01x14_170530 [Parasponia andersonii]